MTDRCDRVRALLDVGQGHGLEIGPLTRPIALKHEADVTYLDLHDAAGLREYYASHGGLPADEIVEVDYTLVGSSGLRSIHAATTEAAPFDWVIASHVIEHVPDLIGWLQQVAEVVVDGGRLVLVIPDRRYTFDAERPPTTPGQLLQAHLDGDTRPSVRAVFDHYSGAVSISQVEAWYPGARPRQARIHDIAYAREMVARSRTGGERVDCHVWLFTPSELVEQLQVLAQLDLLEFSVDSVLPTEPYDMEFYVTLSRLPRHADDAERRRLLSAAPAEVMSGKAAPEGVITALSGSEQRLISGKRRAVASVRDALRRVRRARGL